MKKTPTLHQTFLDIAMILDDESDKPILREKLSQPKYDFDILVKVGSEQLVLPAIYCKLKEWKLTECLPKELTHYLDEITTINRNRNETILSEIKFISVLFQKHDIKHSFLKGSAMLASGYYKDIGERMIGDIDILVNNKHLEQAQKLLTKTEYKACEVTLGDKYFEHKHLPRLIPKKRLSAVEVHRKLIHKNTKDGISSEEYLRNSIIIQNTWVGSTDNLFWHTALNFEVNDYGYHYNFLGLRNAYDLLILKRNLNSEFYNTLLNKSYINNIANKLSLYFVSFIEEPKDVFSWLLSTSFKMKQQNKWFRKICYSLNKIFHFVFILSNRLKLFILNPSYREDTIKDRKRIISILKNGLNPRKT